MSDFVLQTKLHPPAKHDTMIDRPQLLQRLNSGQAKLTLVSAPAGFGKTTLVTQWLNQQTDTQIAWLSLDEQDNSPSRFWRYVHAALRQQPAADPPNTAVPHLLNQITQQPTPITLVLDDYHFISNPVIHETVTFFINHLPAQHHIVLTTRETPPFPLHRWRARQQLREVTPADLRFSLDETTAFLQQSMRLSLSKADIATLEKRTEGWAAGLQMAALSLRHNGITVDQISGNDRYIVDYLLAEVLAQQPADVREFLLHTAVLRRLSAPLCQQLYPHSDAQTTLEQLASHNLFTLPLDNQRRWYRYHHLFAELLQNQLQQQNQTLSASLHEQAAAWYLQHNTDDGRREALHHLLAAKAYPAAFDLLDQHIDDWLWQQGEQATVIHWLDQIPDEVLQTRPRFLIWKAAVLTVTAQISRSRHYLALIPDHQTAEAWRGTISLIQSHNHLATGNPVATVSCAQEAVEFLPDTADNQRSMALQNLGLALRLTDDAPAAERTFLQAVDLVSASPNRISLFNAYIQLGDLSLELGNLDQAETYYQRVITAAEDDRSLSYMPQVAFAHGAYGTVFYYRNQLDQAFDYVQKGLKLSSHIPNASLQFDAPILLSNLYAAQENWTEAYATIDQVITSARAHEAGMRLERLERYRALLDIYAGNLSAAEKWVAKLQLSLDTPINSQTRSELWAIARLRFAQARYAEAVDLLDHIEASLPSDYRVIGHWTSRLLRSLIYAATCRLETALPLLKSAVEEAVPLGHIRLFTAEGGALAHLLRQLPTTPHTQTLLAAFPAPPLTAITLTDRELQILRLLQTNLTTTEIAHELIVSPSTIRTHVKNLYKKLKAHGRDEAIVQAQQQGLL
ncbi:MAG: LuxR C-terminal-related transcriptional regulator [Chloroflexota bacterium]